MPTAKQRNRRSTPRGDGRPARGKGNKHLQRGKQAAKDAYDEAKPWVVKLARFGYAAKGVVYFLIGVLALLAAFGQGGSTTGPTGVFQRIAAQPYGQILLAIIAIGLFGYAVWRLVQAVEDPDHEGSDAKGIVKRIGYAVSGITYGALAVAALGLIVGSGGSSGSRPEDLTAQVMAQPYGRWLIGIVGVIIIGTGLYQFYKGYTAKFKEKLKMGEMNRDERTWAVRAGRMGLFARAVVYALIGIFLVQAALQANPEQAGGLDQALGTLAQQPYGPWLLGLVALGLALYGIYSLVLARYRRIYIS